MKGKSRKISCHIARAAKLLPCFLFFHFFSCIVFSALIQATRHAVVTEMAARQAAVIQQIALVSYIFHCVPRAAVVPRVAGNTGPGRWGCGVHNPRAVYWLLNGSF